MGVMSCVRPHLLYLFKAGVGVGVHVPSLQHPLVGSPIHLLRVDPIQGLHLLGGRRGFGLVVPVALPSASHGEGGKSVERVGSSRSLPLVAGGRFWGVKGLGDPSKSFLPVPQRWARDPS